MLKRFVLYITLLSSIAGKAQYLSVRGDFEVDQVRGCRNLLLTVNNINPGTDVILYQYEGRTSNVTSTNNHTYTTTGSYWLLQYIQGPTGQKVDSIFINILDPVIPDFKLQSCNTLGVQVEINNSDYDTYEIDFGDGTITQVPVNTPAPFHTYAGASSTSVFVTGLYTTANNRCGTSSIAFTPVDLVQPATITQLNFLDDESSELHFSLPPNTLNSFEIALNNTSDYQLLKNINQGSVLDTIASLLLSNNTYCFRIASHDACSNYKSYSNEICTIYANGEAVNDAFDLTWETLFPVGYTETIIGRDGVNLENLLGQVSSYSDTSVVCKNTYCYTIESVFDNGAISRSNQACDEAFSTTTPTSIENISSQVVDGTISWYWYPSTGNPVKYYKVYSNTEVLSDSTIETSITSEFFDDEATCLQLDLVNYCDLSSGRSEPACPLMLNRTFNNDGSITLYWDEYSGWKNNVAGYYMVIYDQNQNQKDSISLGTALEYTDPLPGNNEQVSYYQLWATPKDAEMAVSSSNLVEVVRPPIIAIPNSFTPNDDNLNDVFAVTGKFIQSIELSIFNRWGETIYHVNGSSWDGTIGNRKAPLDTYIYNVVVKDFAGNKHIRNGTVVILKN